MTPEDKRKAQRMKEASTKTGFLFAPVGWQRTDMGRALYERGGIYKKVLNDVRAPASPHRRSREGGGGGGGCDCQLDRATGVLPENAPPVPS